MTTLPYKLVFFAYIAAVVCLCVALGIQFGTLLGMRSARTVGQIQQWGRLSATAGPVVPGSGAVLLASGVYLLVTRWTWSTPWLESSLAGLLAIVLLTTALGGRGLHAIRVEADGAMPGAIPDRLAQYVRDPRTWAAVQTSIGLGIGVVFLLAVRPSTAMVAAAPVAIAGVLGALSALPYFLDVGPFSRSGGRTSRKTSKTSHSSK